MWQVLPALGGVRACLQRLIGGADGEREARAETVRGAHQVAEVQRLRDALRTDGEMATRGRLQHWLVHGSRLTCRGVGPLREVGKKPLPRDWPPLLSSTRA